MEELGEGSGLIFEPSGGGWGYVGDVFDGDGVDLVECFRGFGLASSSVSDGMDDGFAVRDAVSEFV